MLIEIACLAPRQAMRTTLRHLLAPAGLIQIDHHVRDVHLEVRGGSLNARCPFSPMPTNAASIGASAIRSPTGGTQQRIGRVTGQEVNGPRPHLLHQTFAQYLRKLAGATGMPTYSSK